MDRLLEVWKGSMPSSARNSCSEDGKRRPNVKNNIHSKTTKYSMFVHSRHLAATEVATTKNNPPFNIRLNFTACRLILFTCAIILISQVTMAEAKLKIQIIPINNTVYQISNTFWTCMLDGSTSNANLVWIYPNGSRIPSHGNRFYTKEEYNCDGTCTSLFLTNMQPMDEGTYVCKDDQTKAQATKPLMLFKPPVIDTTSPQNFDIGRPALIKCNVSMPKGMSYTTRVSWNKEDRSIKPDKKYKISPQGLYIEKLDKTDNGTYTCVVQEYEQFTTVSVPIEVNVWYPPSIINPEPPKVRKTQGESVTLKCQADGNPRAIITWYKNLIRTDQIATIAKEGNTLISFLKINVSTRKDYARYTCRAENLKGVIEYTYNLEEPGVPGSVEDIKYKAKGDRIFLNITEPSDDGGLVIIKYFCRYKLLKEPWESSQFFEILRGETYELTGLQENTRYDLEIVPVNIKGNGLSYITQFQTNDDFKSGAFSHVQFSGIWTLTSTLLSSLILIITSRLLTHC